MTLKKLVGLAAIGGFLYHHKRRGGQMNLESMKQTARGLFDDVKMRAQNLKDEASRKLDETRAGSQQFGSERSSGMGEDVTGYGSAGYGYGSDTNRR